MNFTGNTSFALLLRSQKVQILSGVRRTENTYSTNKVILPIIVKSADAHFNKVRF